MRSHRYRTGPPQCGEPAIGWVERVSALGAVPEALDLAAIALGRTAGAAIADRHGSDLFARRWRGSEVGQRLGRGRCADALHEAGAQVVLPSGAGPSVFTIVPAQAVANAIASGSLISAVRASASQSSNKANGSVILRAT